MRKLSASSPFQLVGCLALAALSLSCGSSGTRHLQSISIRSTVNGTLISYVATGTYNESPTTVTPLPTSWTLALWDGQYDLTTQPYVYNCANTNPVNGPVTAMAPVDPKAPSTGPILTTPMVTQSEPISCQ